MFMNTLEFHGFMQPDPMLVGSPQPAVAGGGMGGGRPAQMMGFMDAVMSCLKGSLTFSGRASRSEVWWFFLAFFIVEVVLMVVDSLLGTPLIMAVLLLVPASISAVVRRLHDLGKSGWWYWIALIPLVGSILLLVWTVMDGEPQPNAYGDVPTNVLA